MSETTTEQRVVEGGFVGDETGVVVEWLEPGGTPEPVAHEIRWLTERNENLRSGVLIVTLPTGDLTRILLPLAAGVPSDVDARWLVAHDEDASPGDDESRLIGLGRSDYPGGYAFHVRLEDPPIMLDLVRALADHADDMDAAIADVWPNDVPSTGALLVRRPG